MKKQSMKTQTVANTLNRRDFLKTGVAVGGALGAASLAGLASAQSDEATVIGSQSPGFNRLLSPAPIPEAKGARVVIVGGGWSGLTMARYLTRYDASLDVVLIDQNDHFVSCPLSNTWLADQVGLEFLTHSYVTAAHNNGYLFLHAAAVDLDRESRKLFTTLGSVDYDYLVLAPGIDYDYERIGVEDPDTEYALRMNYPGGFMGASEWMLIKEKLHSFQGGTLALTVP
ncbi:MAG: FAD-dependent oxidoreductase, partial [Gammaproteobacteria bacterium]